MTLDPTDWELFRSTGQRMVDDMLEAQGTVRPVKYSAGPCE